MEELMKEIKQFNEERDWDKFHSPENLAKSISIEAGELLECFQWNSENYNKEEVCEELADVFTYCIQMAMKLDVDPKEIILKHSRSFNGSLKDSECIKLAEIDRGTYYKYKRELLEEGATNIEET